MPPSPSAITTKPSGSGTTSGVDHSGSTSALGLVRRGKRKSSNSVITLGQHHFPRVATIVKSKGFEIAMGVVIIANCITMGLEAELMLCKAKNMEVIVLISEHLVTAIFLVEFVLRVLVYGWRNFAPLPGTLWNFLDALLVLVTGVLIVWVLPLLGIPTANSSLQTLTVLRALRLARLVRVVQKFEAFHEVWLLLRGLMESGRVLFWTVVVIFFITYMFAVFGVVLLGVPIKDALDDATTSGEGSNSELEELVEVTGGVLPLMYTLIQVLTLDSWTTISRPMMKYVAWSWGFFYLYIAIAVIVMMNLVTAVIVENALKNSQKDAHALVNEKEKQKQVELARFLQVFADLDLNGDGELSWPEFESAFEDKELSAQLRLLGIEPDNCREIFNMLDTGDGVLSIQEFSEGIACMEGTAQAKDLLRTNKTVDLLVRLLCQQNQELREDLDELLRLTPGAIARERKGSLKSRARRHQSSNDVFITNGGSDTPVSFPPGMPKKGHSFRQTEQTTLSDVMKRLEEVAGMVHESRQQCQEGLAVCSQTILTLSSDMHALKSSATHSKGTLATSPQWDLAAVPPQPITPNDACASHWRSNPSIHRHLPLAPALSPTL